MRQHTLPLMPRETPHGGWRQVSPNVPEAFRVEAEWLAWNRASSGVGVLNELSFGSQRTDHRAHISHSIFLGKVAKRQARNNCVDPWHGFVPEYAAQMNRLATADAHAGKFVAEESDQRRVAFYDDQTFGVQFPFQKRARDGSRAGANLQHARVRWIYRGCHQLAKSLRTRDNRPHRFRIQQE